MPRKPRTHPLNDPSFLRDVERVIQEQRQRVVLPDSELDQAARMTRSDVDRAIAFAREANRGSAIEHLLDGPAGESEQDG